MDFFEHQEVARRRTGRLLVYFGMAVVAIVVAIYFLSLLVMVFTFQPDQPGQPNPYMESPFHPGLFLISAAVTIGVILLGSLYKTSQLAAGGETVALMMGGRPLNSQSREPAEKRLLNIVEEMALASGVPVPPVYVLENEPSINAFAAGHEPGDAVIGVSRGCLAFLNRDELQGVMAHEFSHILNGDMRTNLRLIGLLHGILVIALLGWIVLRTAGFASAGSRRGRDNNGGAAAILAVGLGLLVIGGVGLLFAKLIKSAVSRQREYLADASAVQFTRQPGGIAGALKKIGGRPDTSKINDAHAEEISHMFFGSAFGSFSSQLFSTHPPLADRIKRVDPAFDGKFPERVEPVAARVDSSRRKPAKKPAAKPASPLEAILPGQARTALDPAGVMGQIGAPGQMQFLLAAALLESMPDPLRNAAHEPYGARAVIYAILLDRDPAMRSQQFAALKTAAEELSYRETTRLVELIDSLPDEARLPLIETTIPALKTLSPQQYATFRENVVKLIQADGQIDLLEYTVHAVVFKYLDVHFELAKPVPVRYRQMAPLVSSVQGMLSMLAHAGHEEQDEVRRAFEKGMVEIGQSGSLLPRLECSVRNLDVALRLLAQAAPALKKRIVAACVACIAADGKVTAREGELARAVSAILGVPLPPIAVEQVV